MILKRLRNRLRRRRSLKVLHMTAATSVMPDLLPEFFQPRKQAWYTFNKQAWEAVASDDASTATTTTTRLFDADRCLCKLRVLNWNLEGIAWTFAQPRMESTLDYLKGLIGDEHEVPAIIMLQEMTDINIDVLKSSPWIQERFAITDLNASRFDSTYGVITLIDKRLPVIDVFRVRWYSRFGRDGLFVDVRLPMSDTTDGNSDDLDKQPALATLRLCNTHLESLHSDPPIRPIQVRSANRYLHAQEVHGAVLAGDMNAHGQADGNIASENNLNDAYLELGGVEGNEDGFTWGYQSSRPPQHPGNRLDKVLYCGSLVARKIERIGVGVVVEDDDVREMMRTEGNGGWLSDHYGLLTEFEVMDKTG